MPSLQEALETALAERARRELEKPTPPPSGGGGYATELTPEGEQMVIPGCERNRAPGVVQWSLF